MSSGPRFEALASDSRHTLSTMSDWRALGMPWSRCVEDTDLVLFYARVHAVMIASEVTPLADGDEPGGCVV